MWYYLWPETDEVKDLPFYLISIGLQELQPHTFRPNGFKYDQFFYSTLGSGILTIDGRTHQVNEKAAFFIPASIPHEYYPQKKIWNIRWMIPGGSALKSLYHSLGIGPDGALYPLLDAAPLDVIQNKMRLELIHDKVKGNYYASSLINEYIMEFARQVNLLPSSHNGHDTYSRHMEQLADYIAYHFMQEITVQDLCDVVGITPQHLCRIFMKCTNMRPIEYINHTRIEASKQLLRTTGYSITDISSLCGFHESNYFCRLFKSYENTTPGDYRRRNFMT